jgi:hypothetical protein
MGRDLVDRGNRHFRDTRDNQSVSAVCPPNFTQVPVPEAFLPKLSYLPLISPTCRLNSHTCPLISPNRSAWGTSLTESTGISGFPLTVTYHGCPRNLSTKFPNLLTTEGR